MMNIKKFVLIIFTCISCFNLNLNCTETHTTELGLDVDKKALHAFEEAYHSSSVEKWQEALYMTTEAIRFYKELGKRDKVNFYETNKYICDVNLYLEKSRKVPSQENFENLEKSLLVASYALSAVGRIEEARMYLVMSSQARIKKNYLQVRESPSAEGWRRVENLCSYAYNTYKNTERKSSQYFHIYSVTAKAHADYLQAQNDNSLESWEICKESSEKAFRKFLRMGDSDNCNVMKHRIEICDYNIFKLSK